MFCGGFIRYGREAAEVVRRPEGMLGRRACLVVQREVVSYISTILFQVIHVLLDEQSDLSRQIPFPLLHLPYPDS